MTAALSRDALKRLDVARRTAAGIEAVAELADLLGADGAGRWAVAGELSRRLGLFESTAYPRIARGSRKPRGRVEELLAAICSAPKLPRSRERIYDLIR